MTRWQVFGAVVLRRWSELVPRKDSIESKVQQIFYAYENYKSRYSQHEMQHLEDIRLKDSQDTDVVIKETAQDRLDRWIKEKSNFDYGEWDETLTRTHYLFIKTKFGSDIKEQWLLPQAIFDRKLGDQNLLDTARRALKESLNIINGYRIIGKVPSSVYSFKYPKKIAEMTGHDGAKVFFLKAHLDLPSASVLEALDSSKSDKLKWLNTDEANKLVKKNYMKSLSQGLLHENRVDVDKVLRKATEYAKTLREIRARAN